MQAVLTKVKLYLIIDFNIINYIKESEVIPMTIDMLPTWLESLDEEDLAFIKKFILCSGSLKEIAKVYGVSYPTVRLRLDHLIDKINVQEDQESTPYVKLIKKLALDDRLDFETAKVLINAYNREKSYTLHHDKYQMKNGNYAEIWVKTDSNGNAVRCSDILIKNSKDVIVYIDSPDYTDGLTEQGLQYITVAKYFKDKYKLNIYSYSVKDVKDNMINIGYLNFAPASFIFSLIIIELPLLIILLIGRLRIRYKRQKEELRKLEIEMGL